MPTSGLMHDGRIFDHPDKLDPERWLSPESRKLLEYFLPFSTGPRAGIGRKQVYSYSLVSAKKRQSFVKVSLPRLPSVR
jgi:hypothetical protein